jgi:hypothetical protein
VKIIKLKGIAFPIAIIAFFAQSGEKADQRSVVGMSQYVSAFTLTPLAEGLTRTSLRLFTLSFASKKEGREILIT